MSEKSDGELSREVLDAEAIGRLEARERIARLRLVRLRVAPLAGPAASAPRLARRTALY